MLESTNTENQNYLQYFFDISVELMAIIDINNKFKRVSKSWTDILGWNEEELLDSNWDKFIHVDEIDTIKKFIADIYIKKEIRNTKIKFKCKDEKYKWIECNIKYIESNKIFIVSGRDVTESLLIKEEKVSYEKAIEVETMKNQFFSNVSHEFKTHLNIILTTMQLINSNIESKNIISSSEINLEKYMNSIKQNCYRLLRLVNNIIDMSRIDYGYFETHLGNYNIVSVVEDITMSILEYVKVKGINLIFDTEIEEEIIACDPDKIERIILNLLSNAIKYTDKGGTIKVSVKTNDNNVYISVRDTGIGIPNDKLPHIFDRYTQIDNGITRKWNGSGIGLSLVKSLVELQGGKISAKSEFEKGSDFIIMLPIKQIEVKNNISTMNNLTTSKVEKCNIEFSDIYN